MSNKFSENFRLQLLTHDEVFKTRDEAVSYINDYFKPEALKSEPACVYYGDEKDPKILIAIGTGNRRVFLIDFTMLQDEVNKIDEVVKNSSDALSSIESSVEDIVNSVGLTFDDNKIKDKITYEPDSKDALISDAKDIKEAIDILSKYIQKETISVNETESVSLVKNNGVIEANVRVSDVGYDDTHDFNDNIIGIKPDGLYASAYLDYDNDTKKLTFVTSGFDASGVFKNDAYKKVFDLGNHTEIKVNNKNASPVVLTVKDTDEFTKEISGKLKISEDANNIIEIQDGNLLVDGRASNIKYKDKTVASALNELNKRTETLERDVVVDVIDTNSVAMTLNKDVNGTTFITSDVKLGSDKSIVVANGGLSANIDFDVNTAYNKLIVKIGDNRKELDLPGIDIIQSIKYNQKNNILTISFKNGSEIPIALGDVFVPYNFDSTKTVELHEHRNEDGSYNVYAELKLSADDNALSINDKGELTCSIDSLTSELSTKITEEIARAKTAEQSLRDDLTAEITEREKVVTALGVKLGDEITRSTEFDNTINETVSALSSKLGDEITRSTEFDNTIKKDLTDEIYRAKTEETKIVNDINTTISTEVTAMKNADSELSKRIDDIEKEDSRFAENINKNAEEIEKLKEADNSFNIEIINLQNSLASEVVRASEAEKDINVRIDNDINTINSTLNATNSQLSELDKKIESEVARASEVENTLTTELNKKIESVELVENSQGVYTLKVDGVDVGTVNVPLDRLLTSATYDHETNILSLIFNTEGDTTTAINVKLKDLVDIYEAGNGLKLETIDGKSVFSVLKNGVADEGFLNVDASGIYITGINAIKSAVEKNTQDVKDNNELIKSHSNRIESNSTDLGIIKSEIGSQKTEFTSQISNLYTTTDKIKDDLITNIKSLKDADYALGNRVTANEEQINQSGKKIEDIKSDLEKHKENSANYFISFDKKYEDLVANCSKLEGITQYQGDLIGENRKNIEKNSLDITNNFNKLTHDIDDTKNVTTKLNGLIETESTRAKGEEGRLDEKINSIKLEAIPSINSSLTTTNDRINETNANVAALTKDIESVKTDIKNTTINFEGKINKIEDLANTKVGSVELVPSSDGIKGKYLLIVDGYTKGEINIPSEQLIEKAEFDSAHNELVLVFKTDSATNEVRVPLNDLVVLYQAGEGLKLTDDHVFSIHLNRGANEGYLNIDDSGIYLNGINKALMDQKDDIEKLIDNTKSELKTDIGELSSKVNETIYESINNIAQQVNDNTRAIERETDLRGFAINGINDGIKRIEGDVSNNRIDIDKLKEDFRVEQTRVNTILQGEINIAIQNVQSKIEQENLRAETEEKRIEKTFNSSNEYLMNEMNIIRTTTNSFSDRIDNTVSSIAANTNKITTLETSLLKSKFNTKSSSSVNLTLSTGADDINVLTSEVITSTTSDNIISKRPDGLYANVIVSYNEATNTLSFSNGIRTESWTLKQVSAIKDVQFDPDTKKLIFTISTTDGDKELTSIDVTEFFKGINVSNNNHNVNLELVSDEKGVQVLSGDVKIADRSDNLLENQNGTLYVSKNAEDLLVRDETNANTSLQTVISKLLNNVKEININKIEIDTIKQQVAEVKTAMTDNTNAVSELVLKVENLENKVDNFETKLTNMETIYLPLVASVNKLSQNVTDIMKYIGIDDINNKPIVERTKALEVEMDNLIDFGTYTAIISE